METVTGHRGRAIPFAFHEPSGDPAGTIVVLPGGGYTPAHPVLHFSRSVFVWAGYSVLELWWGKTFEGWSEESEQQREHWLANDVLAATEVAAARGHLVGFVAKSLGTLGLAAAAAQQTTIAEVPAVWLTPILTRAEVVRQLAAWRAPSIAVIAEQDEIPAGIDPSDLGDLVDSMVVPRTNHVLEREDPMESVEALQSVLLRIRDFALDLDPRPE